MHSLAEVEQAQWEWRAWRTVCHELERNGVNLNDDNRLTAALQVWGEELVALRQRQEQPNVNRAYTSARQRLTELGMELATE